MPHDWKLKNKSYLYSNVCHLVKLHCMGLQFFPHKRDQNILPLFPYMSSHKLREDITTKTIFSKISK